MIKYGLINKIDSKLIENALTDAIIRLNGEVLNYCEIGLYNGGTTSGVKEFLDSKRVNYNLTGIDNFKDKEELVFYPDEAKLIQGSSIEVYNQLPDNSQDVILIDGNHSFPYVVADTYCYMPKVKAGGFLLYHDAAPHSQWKSYQRMGDPLDPDMSIAVLKALERVGLIGEKNNKEYLGFELVAHEWDRDDEGGGTIVFKKIK